MATVSEVQADITLWETCLAAIRLNQSYSIGGMQYTRADIGKVEGFLRKLQTRKSRIPNGACVAPKFFPIR